MGDIQLLSITGYNQIDEILHGVVTRFETAFPDRIRGYYVEGSYTDGSSVGSSDLDVLLALKQVNTEEREQLEALVQRLGEECVVELDIELEEEEKLLQGASPMFKFGSLCIYGTDIRERAPLVPLAAWTRDRMHTSYWRTVHLYGRATPLQSPLTYPDPQGEFFGYDRRTVKLADGREIPSTRDLIRLTGWSATGLLAWQAGKYVARKKDCHRLYQETFHDEWGELLQEIYELCRGRWNYLVPEAREERDKLRTICAHTLGFENHFLREYKAFVREQLQGDDEEGRKQAQWVLNMCPLAANIL